MSSWRGAPPAEKPARIFRRLQAAYERTSHSGGEVSLPSSAGCRRGILAVEDPAAMRELSAALDRAFFASLDEERPPGREETPPGQ
jgi:hypothetical protein